jgi:hypothetical protein
MLEMEMNNPREKYRGAIYVTHFLWPQYSYYTLPILWSCWGLSPFPVSDDCFPSCLPTAAVKQ